MDINSVNLAVQTVLKKIRAGGAGVLPERLEEATLNATYATAFEPSTAIVYDATTGNVTSTTEGGITTTYTYNADGTVNNETRLGKVRTWAYDGNGNPTSSTVV